MSDPIWRLFVWLFGPQWLRELETEKARVVEILLDGIEHPGTRELVPLARSLVERYKRQGVIIRTLQSAVETYRADKLAAMRSCQEATEAVGMTEEAWGKPVPAVLAAEVLRLRAKLDQGILE